jgi:murein DD-endopeptidase MepM/ murein hydrolase activator NlpD
MRPSVSSSRSRLAVRLAAVSVVALAAAACSSATERFALSNPFDHGRSPPRQEAYRAPVSAVPSGTVTSAPLPAPGVRTEAAYPSPQPSHYATYSPPPAPRHEPEHPGSITPMPRAGEPAGWSAAGGSTIIVVPGDTPRTLAARYGVPEDAIVRANHLPRGAALRPGDHIVIPVYRSAGIPASSGATPGPRSAAIAAPVPAREASRVPTPIAAPHWHVGPAPAAERAQPPAPPAERVQSAARSGEHVVADGDTLYSVARRYHVEVRDLAAANHVGLDHHVRIGEKLIVPGAGATARTEPRPVETHPPRVAAAPQPAAVPPAARPQAPIKSAQAAPPAAATQDATYRGGSKARSDDDEVTGSTGTIAVRWPVRGRIIAGFGPRPNGTTNDGINLAVPEGTPVQAAAGGTVAYAGNELKGYGDLVLIRHPGGWVTAYAHNSEILVKKGQQVRRGEVIARSGKSGAVDSPQLHFELRHGATPIDPMSHLPQG